MPLCLVFSVTSLKVSKTDVGKGGWSRTRARALCFSPPPTSVLWATGGDAVTFAMEPHPQALGLEKPEEMCQELGELMAQLCRQPQGELGDQR